MLRIGVDRSSAILTSLYFYSILIRLAINVINHPRLCVIKFERLIFELKITVNKNTLLVEFPIISKGGPTPDVPNHVIKYIACSIPEMVTSKKNIGGGIAALSFPAAGLISLAKSAQNPLPAMSFFVYFQS